MSKRSAYKTIAEAITFGGLDKVKVSTKSVDHRRLTVDEIKNYIKEEFGNVKKSSDVDVLDRPKGWSDDALEKEIEWVKKLDLKEFFSNKGK